MCERMFVVVDRFYVFGFVCVCTCVCLQVCVCVCVCVCANENRWFLKVCCC